MSKNIKSLCCALATNIIYINYNSVKLFSNVHCSIAYNSGKLKRINFSMGDWIKQFCTIHAMGYHSEINF